MFSHDYMGLCLLGRKPTEVPFLSHGIKVTCYQLFMLTLITQLRWSLSVFAIINLLFLPTPRPYSLGRSHYAQPTGQEWEGMLHFLEGGLTTVMIQKSVWEICLYPPASLPFVLFIFPVLYSYQYGLMDIYILSLISIFFYKSTLIIIVCYWFKNRQINRREH